jgi:hypothetical protein
MAASPGRGTTGTLRLAHRDRGETAGPLPEDAGGRLVKLPALAVRRWPRCWDCCW